MNWRTNKFMDRRCLQTHTDESMHEYSSEQWQLQCKQVGESEVSEVWEEYKVPDLRLLQQHTS